MRRTIPLRIYIRLILFFTVLCVNPGLAQDMKKNLPIELTPEEETLTHLLGLHRTITDPPAGPVRAAVEWDESIGVFCMYEVAGLMDELQEDNDVYIITENQNWWLSWLSSHGIPTTNFKFLIARTNTTLTRDYGPWFIWDGNHDFGLVDIIYNRVRPYDDVIPEKISQEYGIPYYGVDLIHTGGNYYADGFGNAWSSRLVYHENPDKSEDEVNRLMLDYLGITRYITQEVDVKNSLQHFDTFGKILSPDSMIWGEFPELTDQKVYTEAALKYFQTLQSAYGWPYKIHRMPLWDFSVSWTAYINALQTNKKIITNKYNTSHDAEVKAIYEKAAPGYEVVNAPLAGSWHNSIHCNTRNFVKGDTIRIYPMPHWESTDDEANPYLVTAEVIPDNATSLNGNPVIYWTVTGGAPFSGAVMALTGNPNEYAGAIPAQHHGTTISYYIHAEDLTGRTKDCPLVAPDGMFVIRVEDDVTPPELDHDVIHGLTLNDWPYTITCRSVDNTGLSFVTIEYKINGAPQAPITMIREDGTFLYSGTLTGNVSLGDLIAYRVMAADSASPQNTAASPVLGWNYFTINPKNAILVIDLDKLPDSGELLVDLCDDLGLNVHYATAWPDSLSEYDVVMICLGMWFNSISLTYAQANQLVSFLNAGGAAYMEGGNCFAQDTNKDIYRRFFGIAVASSGAPLESPIEGVAGEITDGMYFEYSGDWKSSDHLTLDPSAHGLLTSDSHIKAVSFSTGTFSTVGASFQIESLVDGDAPSRTKYLAALYLNHLGMDIDLVVHNAPENTRRYTFDLMGDPFANYSLFYALGPGYCPYGPAGIIQIDPGTIHLMLSGSLPAEGNLRFDVLIPDDPGLSGIEAYFQVLMEDTGSNQYYLTNRDRMTIDIE